MLFTVFLINRAASYLPPNALLPILQVCVHGKGNPVT